MEEEKKSTVHYTPAGWVKAERNFDAFMCRCSPEEEEKCDAVMAEALEALSATKEDLLTAVVFALSWDYEASITGIYCDQWCGVSAQTGDGSFGTWVQCDTVEDGIAMTWKAFKDRKEEINGDAVEADYT